MTTQQTHNILGYPVSAESIDACLARIHGWLGEGTYGRYMACANPHSIEVALRDGGFSAALENADILVPDGVGVVIASRFLGDIPLKRITGSDIFHGVCSYMNRLGGGRVFFIGSTEETLAMIRTKFTKDFPNLVLAGTYSPPFKESFDEADSSVMVEAVNRVCPDVLWVGMTAPKQEKWIHQNRHRLHVKFIGAIGAVFDFYSGNVKRSHPLFQSMGLEWLPRLIRQPRRLWRRNFISNPTFLLRVIFKTVTGRDKVDTWK